MCLHLLGRSSVKANAAIWQFAAPRPVMAIPAITAFVDLAVPTIIWPMKLIIELVWVLTNISGVEEPTSSQNMS